MSNSKHNNLWEYPDCPTCNSELYVTHMADDDYRCEFCSNVFHSGKGGATVIKRPNSRRHNNGGGDEIDPPTDKEISQIYSGSDKFVVPRNATQKGARQHLHHNGDKLCSDRVTSPKTRVVDAAVYPPGYNELCKYCVQEWRDNQ